MIKTVIRWQNEMVMVFDEDGKQLEHYQGRYENVKDTVLAASQPETKFLHGVYGERTWKTVKKEDW